MASSGGSPPLPGFFAEMAHQGRSVVTETPKLDLEQYIQNYRGRTRFDRLYHIGRTSVVLSVEALRAAVTEAKKGTDPEQYRRAVDTLREVSLDNPAAQNDDFLSEALAGCEQWVNSVVQSNKKETRRLEDQLKSYKQNMVKESIRIGNEDLGKHYEAIGAPQKAHEYYHAMRQDAGTQKHLIDVCKHMIRVSLQQRDWAVVNQQLTKLHSLAGASDAAGGGGPDDQRTLARYANIVKGIVQLETGHFDEAAKAILAVTPSSPQQQPRPAPDERDVATPNDVATYGAVVALATMDRDALRTKVLESPTFRPFLELEPHLRRALNFYVQGKYKACLQILEAYRADYALDVHLYRRLPELYGMIRTKCIVQYLLPYSNIKMESLEQAFGVPGKPIGLEICGMIQKGVLKARIDSIDKIVVMNSPDPRTSVQKQALESSIWYNKRARDAIRRMSLGATGLEVLSPRKKAGAGDDDPAPYSMVGDPMDLVA